LSPKRPPPLEPEDLEISKLPNQECLAGFDCSAGDESGVTDFYRNDAYRYQVENMGVTYTAKHGEKIIGCITISMNSIKTKHSREQKGLEKQFGTKHPPVVYIGQLGTENDYQGRHVATILCDAIYSMTLNDFQGRIGCRYLALQCRESKVRAYEAMGFETTGCDAEGDYVMVRKIVSARQ